MKTLYLTDPLTTGTNVRALQRRLVAAGYRIRVDGELGPGTMAAVVDAKRRLGYRSHGWQIRPAAGDRFLEALDKARKPLIKPRPKTDRIRDAIVAYCHWGIEHEPTIHYAQTRPFPIGATRALPMRTDCSGFATLAYKDAGGPDPNGRKFDGLGYTGTLLGHGKRVAPEHSRRGDLAVFGPGTGHHVVVLLEDGKRNFDPLTCSHGQERGPLAIRLSEEARAQPSPVVIINYLGD